MANIKEISIKDYTYNLPEERIAKFPLAKRDESKLLIYKDGQISERIFHKITEQLNENDILVFNDTKVIRARLLFTRSTGSVIEILCLEPADHTDPAIAFLHKGKTKWKAMVGNAKRWKDAEIILPFEIKGKEYFLKASIAGKTETEFIIEFNYDNELTFSEVIEAIGKIPLPPYLNRDVVAEDIERYQTVYAKFDGSVAAPTAGLHFTNEVLKAIHDKGVEIASVTLHVGAGTFRPVKAETMAGHEMHDERIYAHVSTIEKLLNAKGKIVATGTTSLRTIESIYWTGVKILADKYNNEDQLISQWDAYELPQNISKEEALNALLNYLSERNISTLSGTTQLLIAPGYKIRIADCLITNFHQPDSTLLLLVSAFIGDDWRKVYDYALENDFRFLSYGDSSLLYRT